MEMAGTRSISSKIRNDAPTAWKTHLKLAVNIGTNIENQILQTLTNTEGRLHSQLFVSFQNAITNKILEIKN